jgi:hypothetical protein
MHHDASALGSGWGQPKLSEIEDFERKLAEALRQYLRAEDDATRLERGRRMSSIVAWLTGLLLKDEPTWSRYWWVDDLLEDSIEAISPLAVEIRGELIWGEQWTEPFRARVSLASPTEQRASYELQLGDAAKGLQKIAYGDRRFGPAPEITEWLFTLRGGPTGASHD